MTVILPVASHTDHGWPRPVLALVLARAVNQLGAFAMSFLAVALVEVYGASLATAGTVVAMFGLATIPSRLVGGRLADRWGRRPAIVTGLVCCAVAQLVIAAAAGVAVAATGAVLLGLAFEIYEPASQAILADLVPEGRRSEAFGLLGAALAAAAVLAGLFAALLGGVDLRLLFVADAMTSLGAAGLVWALVPTGRATQEAPPTTQPRRSPWRDRRLLVMLTVGTGSALAGILWTTTLPLAVAAQGIDPARTGWLLAVSALVTIGGQRLLRHGARRPFGLVSAGLVLAAGGFAVVAGAHGLPAFGAGVVLMALGQVLLLWPPYAVVAGLAGDHSRAAYLAAFGTSWGIAQTLGPLVGTRLLERGAAVPWLAGAALCLALAAVQPAVARAVRRAP